MSKVKATVRFASFEPLLGPIDFAHQKVPGWLYNQLTLNWIIIGALTGRHKDRWPCLAEWVENIERAAARAGVKVFEKDSLAAIMGRPLKKEWPK